jgi:hypothetical protein
LTLSSFAVHAIQLRCEGKAMSGDGQDDPKTDPKPWQWPRGLKSVSISDSDRAESLPGPKTADVLPKLPLPLMAAIPPVQSAVAEVALPNLGEIVDGRFQIFRRSAAEEWARFSRHPTRRTRASWSRSSSFFVTPSKRALFSRRRVDDQGATVLVHNDELVARYNALRQKYPQQFVEKAGMPETRMNLIR